MKKAKQNIQPIILNEDDDDSASQSDRDLERDVLEDEDEREERLSTKLRRENGLENKSPAKGTNEKTEEVATENSKTNSQIELDEKKFEETQQGENEKQKETAEEVRNKKLARRKYVIKEMFDTETTYMDYLKVVMLNFIHPFEKVAFKDKTIAAEYSATLFQSVPKIQDIQWEMYKEMSKRYFKYTESLNWCDIFVDCFTKPEFLKRYQDYVNGYDHASQLVASAKRSLSNKHSDPNLIILGEFIEKQLTTTKFGFASLSSFLIAPVQRLPRYILFFKDLLKCTPEDHSDFGNVVKALQILDSIVEQINTQKGLYDKIYRVEEIYRMFSEADRMEIKAITEPVRELIAEGPMIEGKKNPKQRYFLLFTDLLICTTKGEDSLVFEWKVDLCNSEIEIIKKNDGVEYIKTVTQKKITNYPFTLKESHDLFALHEGNHSIEFWKEKFEISNNSKKNLVYLFQNSNYVCSDMQNHLLSEVGGEDLFLDWDVVEYKKSEFLRRQGKKTKHIMLLKDGICSVQLKVGEEVKVLGEMGPGQFIGEMTYLSDNCSDEVATASVIADSDIVVVLEKRYRKLDQILKLNPFIASKFFHLLCVILANRFIKENTSKLGWKKERDVLELDIPNTILNINNINIAKNRTKIKSTTPKKNKVKKSLSSKSQSTISPNNSREEVKAKRSKTVSYSKSSKFSSSAMDLKAAKMNNSSNSPVLSPRVEKRSSFTQTIELKKNRTLSNADKKFQFKKLFSTATMQPSSPSRDRERESNNNIIVSSPPQQKEKESGHAQLAMSAKSISDPIIHQFVCTSKTQGTIGELVIAKSSLIFSAKVFGFAKKKSLSYFEIQKACEEEENSNVLKIYYQKYPKNRLKFVEYIMKNNNELQRSIQTISSLVQRRSDHQPVDNQRNGDDAQVGDNIESSDFFALRTKDWSLLLNTAQKLHILKGTPIIEQGKIPIALYQLVSGTCRADLMSVEGEVKSVGSIPAGEIFGEISFILGLVSSASVVADTDCIVMALNKSKLEMLLFNEPRIAAAFYRIIAKILRDRLVFNQMKKTT